MISRILLLLLVGLAWGVPDLDARISDARGSAAVGSDTIPNLEEIVAWVGPGGDPERATEEIRAIVSVREPLEATNWIQLLVLLNRIDPTSAPLAVRGVALADAGADQAAVDVLVDGIGDAAEPDRGSLLALAAFLAEDADPTRASDLRVRVMEEAPDVLEIPEIRLRHARWLLSIEARRDEGFRLAEDLIVDFPEHAIAPEARRLVQLERARDAGQPIAPSTTGPPVPNRR